MNGIVVAGAFSALLLLLAITGLILSRIHRRERRLQDRLRGIAGRPARQAPVQIRSITRPVTTREHTPLTRLVDLFGYDKVQARYHALPAWLVLLLTAVLAYILARLAGATLGRLAIVAAPIAWVMLSRGLFGMMTESRRNKLIEQFPDALQMIVRAVRVGMPVSEAMRLVGREAQQPTGIEFATVANDLTIGTPLQEAIKALADRTGVAEYRFFATTLSLQAQTGGGLSETLEGLADVIRKRLALRSKAKAMAAEARASAIAMAILPFLAFFGMMFLNRAYISVMYTTEQGQHMLGIGAASLIVGVLVMRSIIRRSLA